MKKKLFLLIACSLNILPIKSMDHYANVSQSCADIYTVDSIATYKKKIDPLIKQIIMVWKDPNCPFSITDIYFYDNGIYTSQGDILSINYLILREIYKGNYIYAPVYTFKKTRLSPNEPQCVGAIIIGTQNKNHIKELICRNYGNKMRKPITLN